eukprot:SAG31_NODE_4213_length_3461_cov_1.715645_4_plen_229_part_00
MLNSQYGQAPFCMTAVAPDARPLAAGTETVESKGTGCKDQMIYGRDDATAVSEIVSASSVSDDHLRGKPLQQSPRRPQDASVVHAMAKGPLIMLRTATQLPATPVYRLGSKWAHKICALAQQHMSTHACVSGLAVAYAPFGHRRNARGKKAHVNKSPPRGTPTPKGASIESLTKSIELKLPAGLTLPDGLADKLPSSVTVIHSKACDVSTAETNAELLSRSESGAEAD